MNILDIVSNAQDIRDLAGKALSDAAKNLNLPGRSKMKADEIREALGALLVEAAAHEDMLSMVDETRMVEPFEFPNGEVSPAIEVIEMPKGTGKAVKLREAINEAVSNGAEAIAIDGISALGMIEPLPMTPEREEKRKTFAEVYGQNGDEMRAMLTTEIKTINFTAEELLAEMKRRGHVFNTGPRVKTPLAERGKPSARVLAERARRTQR